MTTTVTLTDRAEVIDRRTYRRPLDPNGLSFETREAMLIRSHVSHHRRLWSEAQGAPLTESQEHELIQLGTLARYNRSSVAGRTRWLGGTEYAFSRPVCQFNCASDSAYTVYDVVDILWKQLNGSGTAFHPRPGVLHGYPTHLNLTITPSVRGPNEKGPPDNIEMVSDHTWIIRIGDSAEAWSKAIGKLFNPPHAVSKCTALILDFSRVRGKGARLTGYGWICNGWEPLARAMTAIHEILNRKAGGFLLDEIDILDAFNHCGEMLSTRRTAQLCFINSFSPRASEFARAKIDRHLHAPHRSQSNNDLCFYSTPSASTLTDLLHANLSGADIGFFNGEAALRRAPWFTGMNPCAEILLGSFCNLVEVNLTAHHRDLASLHRTVHLIARANYRQTCVNLDDGILQPKNHQSNATLRLCGLGLTGVAQADWLTDYDIRQLRNTAITAAYSMADELDLPRPKAVTCIKPSGTLSKVFGTLEYGEVTEGIHLPISQYLFNWIGFNRLDPLVTILQSHNYRTINHPRDPHSVLICFPVNYPHLNYRDLGEGHFFNMEPATHQLLRYLRWVTLWADHNVSNTISYSPSEIPAIVELLLARWDDFIAVSWMPRIDPYMTPASANVAYFPQEPVSLSAFNTYASTLVTPIPWHTVSTTGGIFDLDSPECTTNACPVR